MSLSRSRAMTAAAMALGLALSALTGCAVSRSAPKSGKIEVVTSTNVYASIARAVGGDAVEVRPVISDPMTNPHLYETSPQDAAEVADADLVVFNGNGYDRFVGNVLESAPREGSTIEAFAVAHPELTAGTQHDEINEHFWYDFDTVAGVADRIAAELGERRPGQAERFTANAERFRSEVRGLADRTERIAAQRSGTEVVATAPVADYLIERAGLSDITPPSFVHAVEDGKDAPAAAVARIQDALDGRRATALVYNPQTEDPLTKRLRTRAERLGIPVVEATETLTPGASYLEWMGGQVDALARAEGVSLESDPGR
ncbi:metal ABC transporter solute-binding protein [Saccharopolyspora halophila]|uniref:Metal ABC transporter solute-binding protein n=1 Tax=Saccharopolyspora halophila TaxID=405551 RepID=A0ABP5TS41_9PSEU